VNENHLGALCFCECDLSSKHCPKKCDYKYLQTRKASKRQTLSEITKKREWTKLDVINELHRLFQTNVFIVKVVWIDVGINSRWGNIQSQQLPKPLKMMFKYELRACKVGSPRVAIVGAAVLLCQRYATKSEDGR